MDWLVSQDSLFLNGSKEHMRGVKILSLDAPSGLDASTGNTSGICINANATMILAMPKTGLLTKQAREYVGDLFLADIAVPPELYSAPSLDLFVSTPFQKGSILKIINH